MKKIFFGIAFLGAFALLPACNNNDKVDQAQDKNENKIDSNKTRVSDRDQEFMTEAASGGMMEVQLGKMASEKAVSAEVKNFGKKMVEDHSKANDELMTLAKNKNITLPSGLSDSHQKTVDKLSKLTGRDFDDEYVNEMVDDHKNDLDKFQTEADKGDDADVKAFAGKTSEIIRMHYDMIKNIDSVMDSHNKGKVGKTMDKMKKKI